MTVGCRQEEEWRHWRQRRYRIGEARGLIRLFLLLAVALGFHLRCRVFQGQGAIFLGLLFPQGDHFLEAFGLGAGEVVLFAAILAQVVELPGAFLSRGDDLPIAQTQGTVRFLDLSIAGDEDSFVERTIRIGRLAAAEATAARAALRAAVPARTGRVT